MRELKDYFCNYEQTQDLLKLGLSEKYGISAEQYETAEFGYSGFLRSQALDYFRELGYMPQIRGIEAKWYVIDKVDSRYRAITADKNYQTYHEAESALIDKLIELYGESRNI